jgi:hypothetical protein
MLEFDGNKEHHKQCAYIFKYYPHLECTCKEERFKDAQLEVIQKYRPLFEEVGFDDYAIDFSYVEPAIIECMGKALKKYLEDRQADNMPECSPYTPEEGTE